MKGKIYLIPVPIAEKAWHTLPAEVLHVTGKLQYYFAENAKTCRHNLRGLHPALALEPIQIETISKQGEWNKNKLHQWINAGYDVGIMSESGIPAIADPGAAIVQWAHENHIKVKPLTGPSSIFLALCASGCSGQQFAFLGYLPVQAVDKIQALKKLETRSRQNNEAQIFIETPYRNQQLFEVMLKTLAAETKLCIAFHICSTDEFIVTKKIKDWKKEALALAKAPAIFIVQA